MNYKYVYTILVAIAVTDLAVILCVVSQFTLKMTPFYYLRNTKDTNLGTKHSLLSSPHDLDSNAKDLTLRRNFTMDDLVKKFNVSSNGSDVIVFLRVQKTGSSTFSRHLSDHIDLGPACNCSTGIKQCSCLQRWKSKVLLRTTNLDEACGLHGDYARLLPCVDKAMNRRFKQHRKRRHLYITMVRDPLRRYLSEWNHVRIWGQWGASPKDCQYPTATRIWKNVSLEQFMNCQSNPAINRQTHMLGLENRNQKTSKKVRDMNLVKSAMNNLKNFAYFGITEYQELSQILFEDTFNIHFIKGFKTVPRRAEHICITYEQRDDIIRMNWLDEIYYKYAEDLFRLRILKLIERT